MPSSEFNAANYYKRLVEDRQLTGIRCNVCGQLSPEARPDVRSLPQFRHRLARLQRPGYSQHLHLYLGGSRLLGTEGLRAQQPIL